MVTDLTKGDIKKQILRFSLPLFLGNLFQQFYSMADTVIVGRFLGVQAIAAVGATSSLSFLIIGFVQGITAGFAIITSQKFGASQVCGKGDTEVRASVLTSAILSIAITVILTALSISLLPTFLRTMNTPPEIYQESFLYIKIIYWGLFASVMYNLIAAQLRALGDSKTPLLFLILSSLVNIVMDILLVGFLGFGVDGAAYATVFSQLLSAILCILYSRKHFSVLCYGLKNLKTTWRSCAVHIKAGLPMALQCSVTAVGVMIIQTSLNAFGPIAIAGFTAASKVENLVATGFVSLGITMATFCGQNIGAHKIGRIHQGLRETTIIGSILCIASMILFVGFGKNFVSLFIKDADSQVINYALTYIITLAVGFPLLNLLIMYRNALQGLGYSFIPLLGGVLELSARIVVCSTLPSVLGYLGVCIATPAAWFLTTAVLMTTYFRWKKKNPKEITNGN